MPHKHSSIVCLVTLLSACSGQIQRTAAGSADGASSPERSPEAPEDAAGDPQGPGQWEPGDQGDPSAAPRYAPRLLAKREYNNTLRLILKDTYGVLDEPLDFAAALPTEAPDDSGFVAAPDISAVGVEGYLKASRAVADAVAPALATLFGCDVEQGDDGACVASFVSSFGELLYRRPLTAADVEEHVAFYQESREQIGLSKRESALALLRMMLTSPYFLYQWEQGHQVGKRESDEVVRLNPFQVASRLSFFLWGSGPDRALIERAKAGGLDDDAQVAEQARAMLLSERAVAGVDAFYEQWLNLSDLPNLNKNTERFPNWSPELGAAMAEELKLFTRNVMFEGEARVSDLLTSTQTFANASIAEIYGAPAPKTAGFQALQLDASQRAGLLTMPGFLASAAGADNPKPFHLGGLLLERFFCVHLVPADADLIASVPAPKQDPEVVGERAYLEEQTGHATCAGCHTMMNPLAFGLGNFDSLGAWRESDQHGVAVDADATLYGDEFSGPRELALLLAENEEVRACIAKQWFRFATRREESKADAYSLAQSWSIANQGDLNLRDLMLALTATRSFLYRQVEPGESIQ